MEDLLEDEIQQSDGISFDIKHYASKLLLNYLWILFSLALFISGAFVYLRYTTPKYQVSGYILVGGAVLESGADNILSNAGILDGSNNKSSAINNEIFILKSHKINGDVVDSLHLDILVTSLGRFTKQPVLKDSLPFSIQVHKSSPNKGSALYKLKLSAGHFVLEDKNKQYRGNYGQSIIVHSDTILLKVKPGEIIKDKVYTLQFIKRTSAIKKYIARLTIEPAKNGGTGLLRLSVIDELPAQAEQYIKVLISAYNASYLVYKNQAINRAIKFLGQRLETVSSELDQQENQVRDFKIKNQLYDISATANELLSNLQTLDAQKSQNDYQKELLDLVQSSISRSSGKEEIVASANSLQDPILNAQVMQYNELVFRKQSISNLGTEADPRLTGVNDQLKEIRNSILKNIGNIRKQFAAGNKYVSVQENKFSGRFQLLPEKEKQFVELNRKLSIKETQYTFLLQKKEETEIQLVSSDGDISRIADDVLNGGIVSPVRSRILAEAFGVGLAIPCLIILGMVLLNQKIETKKEIERGTSVPILGELSLSPSMNPIVISANNRSAIAEQLRAIRTNLSFIGANEAQKVYVVTSSMSGEGKSFVSLNLGNSMAIGNKKVAILELDLRKPMLSKKLGVQNTLGISNFIISPDMNPGEIIQPLIDYPNLFLLSSGPIPPNPGELIIHPRMAELVNYLRENFDYVILDSPPVGLVADSLSLAKLSDISLFVIRPNYSLRSSLRLVNDLYKGEKLPKLSLVINGIEAEKGYGQYGGYGYGYGYGYGHGYYDDEDDNDTQKENKIQSIIKRIFKKS
ncbi:GumC family protein [Pedobacter metabolipauper]|uniref:Capsular exopolysaccharide synthesis family protein n=1 Tax=Pedobacter metabolipauper TaxID=425513 RepID=A0A4R6SVL8_9SPHI|nr:tyrosine-protein kinase [Pedobacter metabolipauper]TDQ09918.1 capsular exopolysaccharide synthesis family protein [Pedobacter metabolipauper]